MDKVLEALARAIHADSVRRQDNVGQTVAPNPSLVDWEDLPAQLKNAFRDQAHQIDDCLATIGCKLAPALLSEPIEFTSDEIECMARRKHELWLRDREAAGWVLGPAKDVERRWSPDIVPWEELPEEIRQIDQGRWLVIPDVLAAAALTVVPRKQPAG